MSQRRGGPCRGEHGYAVDHASDHGGTLSVYLDDPDGNGVELYIDNPPETWVDEQGRFVLKNDLVPLEDL